MRPAIDDGIVVDHSGTPEVNFEGLLERTPRLTNDATGGGDNLGRVGAGKLRFRILDDLAARATTAEYCARHTEQQADEVSIMNVQVEQRAANRERIVIVFNPVPEGNYTAEIAA